MNLDELLREHGFITEKQRKTPEEVKEELQKYILNIIAFNNKKTAEQAEISKNSVHNFKKKFESISDEESSFIITLLLLDKILWPRERKKTS